jgi:hypothetical protein
MFIIFGWGYRSQNDHGPTVPVKCSNCHNENWLHLLSYRTWFTLFFIPVIPYESRTLLICPICSAGIMLEGDSIDRYKRMNLAAQAFFAGEIKEGDYLTVANMAEIGDSRRIPPGADMREPEVSNMDGEDGSADLQQRYADATTCLVCRRRIGRIGGYQKVTFLHDDFLCCGNVHADCALRFKQMISESKASQLYAANFEPIAVNSG